jgi:DNA-binding PadR family transcriptional regulator
MQIWRRGLTQAKADLLQGTLDPLYRIDQRGWINSKWGGVTETGRRAKFYTLTKAGSKQLTAEEESWDRLAWPLRKSEKQSEEADDEMVQYSSGAAPHRV